MPPPLDENHRSAQTPGDHRDQRTCESRADHRDVKGLAHLRSARIAVNRGWDGLSQVHLSQAVDPRRGAFRALGDSLDVPQVREGPAAMKADSVLGRQFELAKSRGAVRALIG